MSLLSALVGKKKGEKIRPCVYLIRHGKTKLNGESAEGSPDRIRGWTNVPLNDEGRADVAELAKTLKGIHPEEIVCSDLDRAVDTAKIIDKAVSSGSDVVPVIKTQSLRPWNLGDFQGQETVKVIGKVQGYIKGESKVIPGGECFKDFRVRFLTEFKALLDQASKENCIIFVVSHYRNAKCAEAWDKEGRPSDLSIDVETMMEKGTKPGDYDIYYCDEA